MNIVRGTVYLVGAGPGDPGLMTVRGLSLLRQADVVIHDRLVARELLVEAGPDAEILDVGKAPGQHRYAQRWINAILVDRAKRNLSVVRLKGGDPFVFGRGHEEVVACRGAGVPCLVIPGVSSALAAPASVGIPVTIRGLARSVAIVTGQVADDEPAPGLDFHALAAMDTVVVLMGRSNLAELAAALIQAGRSADTPSACIEWAATARQRVTLAPLSELAEAVERDALRSPVVTVVGQTVARADVGAYAACWVRTAGKRGVPRAS